MSHDHDGVYLLDIRLFQVSEFKIEPLVPFYGNETWRCNADGTCYENWLAMEFPPGSTWDKNYTTPCFTDRKNGIFHVHVINSCDVVIWGTEMNYDLSY